MLTPILLLAFSYFSVTYYRLHYAYQNKLYAPVFIFVNYPEWLCWFYVRKMIKGPLTANVCETDIAAFFKFLCFFLKWFTHLLFILQIVYPYIFLPQIAIPCGETETYYGLSYLVVWHFVYFTRFQLSAFITWTHYSS